MAGVLPSADHERTGASVGTLVVVRAPTARPSALSRNDAERGAEHELRELRRLLPLRGFAPGRGDGGTGRAASGEAPTQCPDNLSAYEGSDERLACICSPERMGAGAVWGTDTYTADSATCRAALHAGAAGRRGGAVSVAMLPGQARYPGTTRNGVQSIELRELRCELPVRAGASGHGRGIAAGSGAGVRGRRSARTTSAPMRAATRRSPVSARRR